MRGNLSHSTYISILNGAVGAINGALIFIFTEIYKILCKVAVNWENHKLKSEE